MAEYDQFRDFVQKKQDSAVARAMPDENDDPDRAARAIDIGNASGIDPSIAYGDLDGVENQFRGALTSQLIRGNPQLQSYVNSHPLAAKVSSDDWGTLNTVSQSVKKIGDSSVVQKTLQAFKAVTEGAQPFEGTNVESMLRQSLPNLKQDHPALYLLLDALDAPLEIPARAMNQVFGGAQAAISETYRQITGDEEGGKKLAAELMIFPQVGIPEFAGPHVPPELNALAQRAQRSAAKVRPYVRAGVEPPLGVDGIIDQIKAQQSKQDVGNLMDALRDAQKSATRERNPDMFAEFIRQHTNAEIGISADAVRKLYGDSIPMPDDGLLGWVPGIEDQLLSGDHTGGDIKIPLADWLARVEPETARELREFTRVRAGGLTLDEVKNLKPVEPEEDLAGQPLAQREEPKSEIDELRARLDEPKPTIKDETQPLVDSVRDSAGLKPIGRSFKLSKVSQGTGPFANVHDFDFVDEEGKKIGDIQLTDKGKDLFVEYVRHDDGPQAFGPRAIRDIAKQLKEQFPEAKTISGIRVSGAREAAAGAKADAAGVPRGWSGWSGENVSMPLKQAGDLLSSVAERREGGVTGTGDNWVELDQGLRVQLADKFTENEQKIYAAVDKVAKKLAPRLVDIAGMKKIAVGEGTSYGVFQSRTSRMPFILWAMESPDQVGTVRHEIIHHLRRTGFFTREEWSTLRDAAVSENWMKKYETNVRWKGAGLGAQIEEAIAEHFANWNRREYQGDLPTGVQKIFTRMQQLYNGIREAVRSTLGYEADWKDIFAKVDKGEVGSRRGVVPLERGAYHGPTYQRPEQGELDTRIEDKDLFAKANAVGMTVKSYKKYLELMEKQDAEDNEFAKKQNLKDVTRRQTEEWKAAEKKIRDEIRPDFENRPDIAADKFLREGVLYGDKVKGRPRLDTNKLTPEQKGGINNDYHTPGGLHPDDTAGLFGYHSGTEMVDGLTRLDADRKASGLTPQRYINKLVDVEVERRMRQEHGDLAQNILDEAQEHVISQTQFDMLHEETLALATKAGMEMSLTKEDMKAMAEQGFGQLRMGQVGVEEHLRNTLRANELAERAILDNDAKEGFKQKQRQLFSFLYAREAKKLEKQRTAFEKNMKRFSAREVPAVAQEYTNFIHQIMLKIGYGVKRSVQDLNFHIDRSGYKDLEDFWSDKTNPANVDPREMPVAEFLMDPAYKKSVDQMKIEEWRAINDTIKGMIANGRDEKTILKAGEKADLEQTRAELIDQIKTFAEKKITQEGTSGKGLWRGAKTMVSRLLQLESIFNRIDRGDPRGLFNTLFSYPASEAGNHFAALTRKYSKQYLALKKFDVNLDEKLPGIFTEPLSLDSPSGPYLMPMTRKSLRAVLQNAGNASNLDKLARGYQVKPEQIMQWLHQHALKEDWDWAQAQGKIWEGIFDDASRMIENLSGLPPEKLPLTPIQTRFGTYEGWYHKIVYDPNRPGTSKALMGRDPLEQLNFTRATTPRSWEKQRTGYAAPIQLSLDANPRVMGQVLRDIAFRPFIHEAAKIFYDPEFQRAFTRHFGDIYKDMLIPYLQDIGSTRNVNTKLGQTAERWVEFTRQNIISTLIGMNIHTVYKHGFSAAVNSLSEVGVKEFGQSFATLLHSDPITGQRNWDFALQKSEELQRRHQQWVDTLGGAHEEAIEGGGGVVSQARSKMIRWGAAPVAFFDLLSAVPTFLAEYGKQIEAGSTEGDAIALGNRAVRRAHGSTAITSRPEAMRGGATGRLLTSLYGFFNQMLQRQYEIGWRTKEMVGDFKQGEYDSGKAHIPKISMLLVSSVIAPALIEEMVTGHYDEKKEGWIERAAKGIVGELSSSLPVVRDIVHALINRQDPSIGLANTVPHEVKNLVTDLTRPGMSMNKQHAGDLAKHFTTVFGMLTGLANAEMGRFLKFAIDTKTGHQQVKGAGDLYRGVTTGQTQERK